MRGGVCTFHPLAQGRGCGVEGTLRERGSVAGRARERTPRRRRRQ